MIDFLEELQTRIKGSRLYSGEKNQFKRLYIPYIRNGRGVTSTVYFEIVNDKLTPFVKVENTRNETLRDLALERQYLDAIYEQFHEIIYDCELKRKKIPLNIRLSDSLEPVHNNSLKHQAEALRFCCSMKVSALFADTGTGKSKIAIDLCISRYQAKQIRKVLIICPVSVKKSFQREIEKWDNLKLIDWKLVGHETIGSSDKTIFELLNFVDSETQIIVDESHLIKNPIAKRSKRIKLLCEKTSYKLVMTGTPVSENVHNLYMQYAVLSEMIINVPNWLKFEQKYCILGGFTGTEIIGYKNLDYLMGLLEPYTWQIDKKDCLDLPAVCFSKLSVQMNQEQWHYYSLEKDWLLEKIKNDNVSATDIFSTFTKMQQISSGYYKGERIGSDKVQLFKKVSLDRKTIIFCKYLFEVEDILNAIGIDKCAVFTGSNFKYREAEFENFIKGQKSYFIATMQSGGTGLNGLQEVCSQVIFYSNSFSYLQRKQSIGRIDRKGQLHQMSVIDFSTNAGIDERIFSILDRKSSMTDQIQRMLNDKIELKRFVNSL